MSVEEAKFFFQVADLNMGGGFGGIQTTDWHDRDRTTEPIQEEVIGKLMGIEELRSIAIRPAPLPGAGQFDVELMVTSADEAADMEQFVNQIIGAGYASGKFVFADSDLKIDLPQTIIEIDRRRSPTWASTWPMSGATSRPALRRLRQPLQLRGSQLQGHPPGRRRQRPPEQLLQFKVRTPDGGSVTCARSSTSAPTPPRASSPASSSATAPRSTACVAPGVTKEEALTALEAAAKTDRPARLRDRLRRREPPDAPPRAQPWSPRSASPSGSSTWCSPPSSAASATRSSSCWAPCRSPSPARSSSPSFGLHHHQHLLPGRPHHARRPRGQERHPDRRVRQPPQESGLSKLDAVRQAAGPACAPSS
jgi:hypothetical protein